MAKVILDGVPGEGVSEQGLNPNLYLITEARENMVRNN